MRSAHAAAVGWKRQVGPGGAHEGYGLRSFFPPYIQLSDSSHPLHCKDEDCSHFQEKPLKCSSHPTPDVTVKATHLLKTR